MNLNRFKREQIINSIDDKEWWVECFVRMYRGEKAIELAREYGVTRSRLYQVAEHGRWVLEKINRLDRIEERLGIK